MELYHITINYQKFGYTLYFEAFENQKPNFLVHKSILDVYLMLCNLNNYDEPIVFVSDKEKTDFKLWHLKV